MLTVDHLSQLTTSSIHKALVHPESATTTTVHPMGHAYSQQSESKSRKPKPIMLDMGVRRSFSETYAPHVVVPQHVPPVPKLLSPAKQSPSSSPFSRLLRKKKVSTSDSDEDAPPPPLPPKDYVTPPRTVNQSSRPRNSPPRNSPPPLLPTMHYTPPHNMSEFALISHGGRSSEDEVVIRPDSVEPPRPPPRYDLYSKTVPLKGKWAREPLVPSDPKERERRRQEARRQRELEEQQAAEEERRRQEEIKKRKQLQKLEEEEEERRRRVQLEEELRRIAAEKERLRRLEEEEEERKKRELELRKQHEREKRMREHQRLEEWREEQRKAKEEEARRAEEAKKREEMERLRKIQNAEKMVAQSLAKSTVVTGWVTIQFHDSLFWKRRYYKFVGTKLHLCRSPKELDNPLEVVELQHQLSGLKEWSDGYEELEAIPFSFVVEFKDERRSWSMYSDSEDDKFRFLGLLHHAAGL